MSHKQNRIELPQLLAALHKHHREVEVNYQRQIDKRAGSIVERHRAAGTLRADLPGDDLTASLVKFYRGEAKDELVEESGQAIRPRSPWETAVRFVEVRFTVPLEWRPEDDYVGSDKHETPFEERLSEYAGAVWNGWSITPDSFSAEIARLDENGAGEELLAEIWEKHREEAQILKLPEPNIASADDDPAKVTGDFGALALRGKGHGVAAMGDTKPLPAIWKPPADYVGVKTILQDRRFRKDGKNPPRTTIQQWERDHSPPARVADPASGEIYLPETWVDERWKEWSPRLRKQST
jgi:hypothetical protein